MSRKTTAAEGLLSKREARLLDALSQFWAEAQAGVLGLFGWRYGDTASRLRNR